MVSAQTEAGAQITIEALELGAVDFIPKMRGATFIHEKLQAAAQARRFRQLRRNGQSAPAPVRRAPKVSTATLRKDAKIVVVGSSTGGPQALVCLLSSLPSGFPVPIVVAQHMPPHFTEALAKRLDSTCSMRVVHASDAQKLMPGTVYIAPGGSIMRVKPGEIHLSLSGESQLYKPSVDVLTQSVVANYGKQAIGVLLTGMGSDGANEMLALHKAGGYTIAQDQASCVVYGMPKALADNGGATEILPIDEIGSRLATLVGAKIAVGAAQAARATL